MPDANKSDALEALGGADERWRAAFAVVLEGTRHTHAHLDQALVSAGSTEVHDRARATLRDLVREGERAVAAIRLLADRVDELREEWTTAYRYTPKGLAALKEHLDAAVRKDALGGARAWLFALLDAADAGEEETAAAIATARLAWPERLRSGASHLRTAFAHWREAGRAPDLEPIEELAWRRLEGWDDAVTPELQSRAHRFAAWTVLRSSGDQNRAAQHMEEAVRLYPYAGRMHAEQAAFHLFVGDFDRAATDAQHAIEVAPRDPFGYLMLGVWAELTGKFSAADDLYRRGFRRMPTAGIARIHERTALVDPPGRLLKIAAAALLEAGRAEQALELANEALLSGVRGTEAHPEAEVHVIRRRALEQLPQPALTEAAEAAVRAGRLCIWNGDVDCAIGEFNRAIELDTIEEAGWLLADALLTKSFPLGEQVPDQALVGRARSTWEDWAGKVGLPSGGTSWAYVTRAIASDLESQRPGADRRAGLFEALMFVEKALVLNHTDAQRLGYVAQFLRYLGLEQLAFEAAEAGYRLASADRQVLAERLPLLANRREFEEAEAVALRLVAMYGEDPWVSAVRAWLALHYRKDWAKALELLVLPIAEGNDQAWYREMQALAYVGLGRVPDAHEAYRRILEAPPIDGNTKCRLAFASLVLEQRSDARRWLAEAREDPTTPHSSYLMTTALEALAADNVEMGAQRLEEAVRRSTSPVEVDDVVFETTLAMRALTRDEEQVADRERALIEVTKHAVAEHKAWLERNPPTADSELEAVLTEQGEAPLDVPGTALLALAARRDAAAGRVERALQRYERLRGSQFEPEATIAFERELEGMRRHDAAYEKQGVPGRIAH